MTQFTDQMNAIRSRFYTNVTVAYPVTTIFDNAPDEVRPDSGIWARFRINTGNSLLAAIGCANQQIRTPGIATAQIFNSLEQGEKDSWDLAEFIASEFRTVTIPGTCIKFQVPQSRIIGRSDNIWWQLNIDCPFFYDSFLTGAIP